MKAAKDIYLEHVNDDGEPDLDAIIAELEPFPGDMKIQVDDYLRMLEGHNSWAVNYLAGLVLDMLDATDALPQGADHEKQVFAKMMWAEKAMRVHDMVRQWRDQQES